MLQRLARHPAVVLVDAMVVRRLPPLPPDATLGFYRTAAGAELDLVVEHRGRRLGIEVKFAAAPKPARGFWQALDDLQLDRAFVVAPVERRYPIADRVEVVGLRDVDDLFE